MNKIRVILIPIYFVVLIFSLDFLLTLDFIRLYTESKLEYYFYKTREDLIQINLVDNQKDPQKKNIFILGTSHFGELSNDLFSSLRPDLLAYNYSAPSASFMYYAYILNKALKSGVKPSYLILEVYPYSTTDTSNYFALRYSYDLPFLLKYYKYMDFYDLDIILRSKIFKTQSFPFKPSEIFKKIKNPQLIEIFNILKIEIYNNLTLKNGGISNNLIHNILVKDLNEESEIYLRENFLNFKVSQNQMYFLKEVLKVSKEENIKIIMVKPILFPYLDKKISELESIKNWNKEINLLVKNYNIKLVNLQEYENSFECLNFIDSHHLSGGCYGKPTEIIINSLDN